MRKINIRDYYEEYGLYNTKDIINNFENIYGMELPELTSNLLLTEKRILSKEQIIYYCTNNFNNLNESFYKEEIDDEIIKTRLRDYRILNKNISIYKQKSLTIIDLLTYLTKNRTDTKYEELLKKLDINHYKSIICGRDAVRILEALNNNITLYKEYLTKINNPKTYNIINYDYLYLLSNKNKPNPSIISKQDIIDKTSIALTKKISRYK